jgi:hypothetical protein
MCIAGEQTHMHRVREDRRHDRDRRRHVLGGDSGIDRRRDDQRRLELHQFLRQGREAFDAALREPIHQVHVPPFDIPQFPQALLKKAHES